MLRYTYSIYLCFSRLTQSLSMVKVVVLLEFQSSFADMQSSFVLKWLKSARSHELILFEVKFIQVLMSIELHFSVGPIWMGSPIICQM